MKTQKTVSKEGFSAEIGRKAGSLTEDTERKKVSRIYRKCKKKGRKVTEVIIPNALQSRIKAGGKNTRSIGVFVKVISYTAFSCAFLENTGLWFPNVFSQHLSLAHSL